LKTGNYVEQVRINAQLLKNYQHKSLTKANDQQFRQFIGLLAKQHF